MTYEEKRELRLQISQLLADAGLNQGKIREMVETEIKNKVDRAVDQALKNLDAQAVSGDYVKDRTNKYLNDFSSYACQNALKEELKNRVIQVVLKDVQPV